MLNRLLFRWKLNKLNKEATEDYIKNLEKNLEFWKQETYRLSLEHWKQRK